jgi:predicted PurR-regulated permease PerM
VAGTRARSWPPETERVASVAVLVAVVYLAYRTLRPVLVVVVLAAALASLTAPLFDWTVRRLRGRRRLASALLVTALLLAVIGTLATVTVAIAGRLVGEVAALRRHPETLSLAGASRLGRLGPWLVRAEEQVRVHLAERIPSLLSHAGQLAGALGQALGHAALGLFLLAVTLYYFYLNGRTWRDRVIDMAPLPPDEMRAFFERFHQVSLAVLVGNLGTAVAQGATATLGYWVLGVPAPLLLGALTVLAALIPLVGTWLVWGPLALWLGLSQSWTRALLLLLYGLLVVGTIDNVLRPLLTRRGLRENPLLIFLAVFGGLSAYGVAGLFLGPLIIVLAITVVSVYATRPVQ